MFKTYIAYVYYISFRRGHGEREVMPTIIPAHKESSIYALRWGFAARGAGAKRWLSGFGYG